METENKKSITIDYNLKDYGYDNKFHIEFSSPYTTLNIENDDVIKSLDFMFYDNTFEIVEAYGGAVKLLRVNFKEPIKRLIITEVK